MHRATRGIFKNSYGTIRLFVGERSNDVTLVIIISSYEWCSSMEFDVKFSLRWSDINLPKHKD